MSHQPVGRAQDRLFIFNRARPGNDREMLVAKSSLCEPNGRIVLVHLATGQLVGLGDPDQLEYARQNLELRESIEPVFPVMPIAVRVAPGIGCGVRPIWRIVSKTRSIWSGVEWPCMTTSIKRSSRKKTGRRQYGTPACRAAFRALAYHSSSSRNRPAGARTPHHAGRAVLVEGVLHVGHGKK